MSWYDQPELSGEFIVDGGGGILLPLAGSVSLSGLTLAEAQQLIQERFADGVLVQPAVSVRITEYRPIFVTGQRQKAWQLSLHPRRNGQGGNRDGGRRRASPSSRFQLRAVSDSITAQQRVRQLEADHATLLMRKARLEAQRDGHENFVMPLLVGLEPSQRRTSIAPTPPRTTRFCGLEKRIAVKSQALQKQRPRIEAEIRAVLDQIAKQKEHLGIVMDRLADLELLFGKGLLRKEVLLNQQIEKSLVEGQCRIWRPKSRVCGRTWVTWTSSLAM